MKNVAPRDASEIEAIEQREWLESLDYVVQQGDRGRVQRLLASLRHRARSAGVSLPFTAVTAYVNTLRPVDETPHPGQPGDRTAHQEPRALECDGHGRAREPAVGGHRRPHLDVRVGGDALRDRVQPFLPSPEPGRRRRPGVLPGPRVARHLRAGVPRGTALRRKAAQLPAGARRGRGPVVVSASVADARLLAVPHGLDGPRPHHVDLSGALQPLPRGSRAAQAVEFAKCGRFSATARPTSRNRSARSASRRARSSTT